MEVTWDDEKECFQSLAKEIAEFYCLQYSNDDNYEGNVSSKRSWAVENIIFPNYKNRFFPPNSAAGDGSIIMVADLNKLYKIFERC